MSATWLHPLIAVPSLENVTVPEPPALGEMLSFAWPTTVASRVTAPGLAFPGERLVVVVSGTISTNVPDLEPAKVPSPEYVAV